MTRQRAYICVVAAHVSLTSHCRPSVCVQVPSAAAGHGQPGGGALQPGQAARLRGRARAAAQGGDGEGPGAVPAGVREAAEEAGGTAEAIRRRPSVGHVRGAGKREGQNGSL